MLSELLMVCCVAFNSGDDSTNQIVVETQTTTDYDRVMEIGYSLKHISISTGSINAKFIEVKYPNIGDNYSIFPIIGIEFNPVDILTIKISGLLSVVEPESFYSAESNSHSSTRLGISSFASFAVGTPFYLYRKKLRLSAFLEYDSYSSVLSVSDNSLGRYYALDCTSHQSTYSLGADVSYFPDRDFLFCFKISGSLPMYRVNSDWKPKLTQTLTAEVPNYYNPNNILLSNYSVQIGLNVVFPVGGH